MNAHAGSDTVTGGVAAPLPQTAGNTRYAGRLGKWGWALFQLARDPYYALIVVYLFGPYFTMQVIGDPVRGQQIWGYINGFAGLMTACMAPFLGGIADRVGRRKPWIAVMVGLAAPAILLLWLAVPGDSGIGIVAVAVALAVAGSAFAFSEVFHNAMLTSIVPHERLGQVSGWGMAIGNLGTFSLLTVMLIGFSLPASGLIDWEWLPDSVWFGLDTTTFEHERIVAPVMALWLVLFSLPLFLFTPDRDGTGIAFGRAIREGIADVVSTVRRVREHRNIATYLIARMLFNDATLAAGIFAMIYAAGMFGWGGAERLLIGLFLSLFAIGGGFLGGWLDGAVGTKKAVLLAMGFNSLALVGILSVTPTTLFFIGFDGLGEPVWDGAYFRTLPEIVYILICILFALFIPVAAATCRTMLARLAPKDEITKFFGLYALSGQVTIFIGPLMVAFFTGLFASARAGLASTLILFGAAFLLMLPVKEERAG